MRPALPPSDMQNCDSAYTEFSSECGKIAIATTSSYFNNLRCSQLGFWRKVSSKRIEAFRISARIMSIAFRITFWMLTWPRAFRECRTVLCNHIVNIILMRTQKQMIRVAARRVITFMQNPQSFGNWPFYQLVSKAVGRLHVTPTFAPECTVAKWEPSRIPNPTVLGIIFSNTRPKDFAPIIGILSAFSHTSILPQP